MRSRLLPPLPAGAAHAMTSRMLRFAMLALLLAAAPALAAPTVDRETAVSILAGFYNSADVCNLSLSRAKVDAYRDSVTPAGDAMFNVDVFRATQALYTGQKDWTKEQTDAYCKDALAKAKELGVTL